MNRASFLRSVAGLEDVLDEACGNDVEDELALELEDNNRNEIFRIALRFPFLVRWGFWPLAFSQEYPWSSQSFPSDRNAGVSSSKSTVTKRSRS